MTNGTTRLGPPREGGGGPLGGRRILVTRPREQASELSELLERLGAEVLRIPAIRIDPPSHPEELVRTAAHAHQYDWILLTSVNGVEQFAAALVEVTRGSDRPLSLPWLGAIGPATASALQQHFGRVDLVADIHTAEGLVEALERAGAIEGRRFLLPQADGARDVLASSLRDRGARVDQVQAYRTVVDSASKARMRQELESGLIDMVTFTSASAVRGLIELAGGRLQGMAVATIGPVTAAAAREAGVPVDVEADPHTVPGLVDAITRFYAAGRTQVTE